MNSFEPFINFSYKATFDNGCIDNCVMNSNWNLSLDYKFKESIAIKLIISNSKDKYYY